MCCGARVEITSSGVRVLEDPQTKSCPLTLSLHGYSELDREKVRTIVLRRIEKRGFASKNRSFMAEVLVPFGASEMMMSCLESGLFDCAVTVCEGAGTVLASNPKLVQMIGAFLTGIIETTPVPEIIEVLKSHGGRLIDETKASIDQVEGVRLAATIGFKNVAVTVAGFRSWEVPKIRDLERDLGINVTVLSVCTTRSGEADLENLLMSDIVWSCNSKVVREKIAPRALFQLGVGIPVLALTERGKKAMLTHLSNMRDAVVAFRAKLPYTVQEKAPR
ncbi:MAG: DUF2099 family protein [Candidatus Nezhaarchaeota archaeon]|nr:DUF2099 family protein [Candidatus Nezhaarchaeota archaeon]